MKNPNPYDAPTELVGDSESTCRHDAIGKPAIALWAVGYLAQIVLFGLFISTIKTKFAITEFENSNTLFIIFNCLIVFCGLVSLFSIAIYTKHVGIGTRIAMAVGSIALFAASYFAFFMICVSLAFSGM